MVEKVAEICIPGNIGVGAQSILGGQDIFARKFCIKINKMPEFYVVFAHKIIKMLEYFNNFSPEKLTKFSNFA